MKPQSRFHELLALFIPDGNVELRRMQAAAVGGLTDIKYLDLRMLLQPVVDLLFDIEYMLGVLPAEQLHLQR